ncbi:ribosomal-protein-alanine N-acetyltransferase [Dyella sp. M7H15-1]|uniref:ribosomal protein S18-alanine N-acetyltransferase n=1 Tax=Dyella sp. M7H15-1 TaxID=2501295 RepID=UPI0010050F1E|nr:ribosomal protein S18-alanine N-acetyltransferase [Dyella sp. M7H15-1]QAU23802.1 ribosomal-protein-alanine N-acetyltransferase [Dyella sp. M7H15-1]
MVAVARPLLEMRAMCRDDLLRISELENASYDFPWTMGIFGDCLKAGHPSWVLCLDRQVIGYGILSVGAGEAHVLNVCIDPEQRGQGLGRHLMKRLLDIARWNGAERVFLEVRPSNSNARQLYVSMDFREIGRRPRYYPAHGGREDAIVMSLEFELT